MIELCKGHFQFELQYDQVVAWVLLKEGTFSENALHVIGICYKTNQIVYHMSGLEQSTGASWTNKLKKILFFLVRLLLTLI